MFNWTTTGLPNPTTDLSVGVEPSVTRVNMDSGRPRQHKRFTSAIRTISVSWQFTDAEFALFQGILEHRLNQGADWFQIMLPTGDGMKLCTARIVGGKWSSRHIPVLNWAVSASLDVKGGSPLTSAEVDAILTP